MKETGNKQMNTYTLVSKNETNIMKQSKAEKGESANRVGAGCSLGGYTEYLNAVSKVMVISRVL